MEKKCSLLPAKVKKCWTSLLVLFLLFSSSIYAQNIQVGGTIRDNKGVKLADVSVKVKGSSTGTTTDSSGTFTLFRRCGTGF